MFDRKKARQCLSALNGKICGTQGRIAGSLMAMAASSASFADVSPAATAMTSQISEDVTHYKDWALGLFTTLFLVVLLMKMSKKWGNRGTSA